MIMIVRNTYAILYKFLKSYGIIVLGFIMFTIYIFFRFIKERLQKDIPFNFSILSLFIIVEICCIYFYIVFRLIKPANKPNADVQIILDFIFKPLEDLDSYIKSFPFIKFYNEKFILWLVYFCTYIFKTSIFDIIFLIIPRIILISMFTLDIFYFHKLHYIYYALPFCGILLFLRRYIIYSIKALNKIYNKDITLYIKSIVTTYVFGVHPSEWSENYDPEDPDNDEWPPTMSLPVNIYIEFYVKNKVYEDITYPCDTVHMTKEFSIKYPTEIKLDIHGKPYKDYNLLCKQADFYKENELKTYLDLCLLLEYYSRQSNLNIILRIIKITIFSIYFICWASILYISIHTLNILELLSVMNISWIDVLEPFSDNKLTSYEEHKYFYTLMKLIKKNYDKD